jgi:MFS family permease
MKHMKRNVLLLAAGQAVMMSGAVLLFATGSLVGQQLAADKSLATLPLALQMATSLAVIIPASFLMARIGRRAGFLLGAALAVTGAGLASYSILAGSFALFCLAASLIGAFAGIGNYFRFAAVDAASPAYRARAVSYVLAGGVIAAMVGPNLGHWGEYLLSRKAFAGGYLLMVILYALAFLLLTRLDIPRPQAFAAGAGRPLPVILRQPAVGVAVLAGALSYGVMALIMAATPLAMHGHQHAYADTALVIEWHVLGMFAPSFFTGRLIQRFGIWNIMITGALLTILCVIINLAGTSVAHFWVALFLLGVGWNFLFIGATQLLTTSYAAAEQAKVQAANDFAVFGISTLAVLSAGLLEHYFGWAMVNMGVIPGILVIIGSLLWHRRALVMNSRPSSEPLAEPRSNSPGSHEIPPGKEQPAP